MELKEGQISILVNREFTTIELHDAISNITFARIKLTPEELSSALSRLSHTSCTIIVAGLDKLGKKHENKQMEFEIPNSLSKKYPKDLNALYDLAIQVTPIGWQPDNYFGSQNSFFTKDNKHYARCTIRRWVEI